MENSTSDNNKYFRNLTFCLKHFDFAINSFKIISEEKVSKLFVINYTISHFYLKGQLCRKINCRASNFLYL